MRSENQYLTGFNKIRENITIGNALQRDAVYSYPDRIQAMFPGESGKERLKSVMPNLIQWVFMYLEDVTMGMNESCTMDELVEAMKSSAMIASFTKGLPVDLSDLAVYIVVEVLQNGGVLFWYDGYDPETGKEMSDVFRLIEETNGRYRLSLIALDFLFRQKDIDDILEYDFANFKLRVHMAKGAYLEAFMATRELLQTVRRMRYSLRDWEIKFKDNITQAKVREYRHLTDSIKSLFEENEKSLKELEAAAKSQEEILKETVKADEKTRDEALANVVHLQGVIDNLNTVQHEQTSLLAYQVKLRREYAERLERSVSLRVHERLSMKRDIVDPLLKNDEHFSDALEHIFQPLFLPEIPKAFTLGDIFLPQDLIEEEEVIKEEGISLEIVVDEEKERRVREKEARNSAVMRFILEHLEQREVWRTSELVAEMTDEEKEYFTEQNAFMHIVLEFSSASHIDIRSLLEDEADALRAKASAEGEYSIKWHICNILDDETPISHIHTVDTPQEFVIETKTKKIRMSDVIWVTVKEEICTEDA